MATEPTILSESPQSDAEAAMASDQHRSRAKTNLTVSGMTCGNCARHVTEALQSVSGVQNVLVDQETNQATIRWKPDAQPNDSALISAVEAEGFQAEVMEKPETHDHSGHAPSAWQATLWVGLVGTLPLMVGEWLFHLGMVRWFQWLSFVLAGMVQVFAGGKFYKGAWNQLKAGSSNMDTLVALGSTTAFAYSTWALFSGQPTHLYFMEAAAIITLISVGHWMESRVSARASDALRKLLNLAPAMSRRLNGNQEHEVPVAELQKGDIVALRPGDRVPTDGTVTQGNSAVDEAMLTGESAPIEKGAGAELYAGTVNLNGRLLMRVTAVGEETALAHIIMAVQRAQSSRANIQRLGDRVSSVFVPIVVSVALAAGLWWGLSPQSAQRVHDWLGHYLWAAQPPAGPLAAAFIIAAAVLIVACPCAMGLATPIAIMAGSNAAAQRGILIRDGIALEKAGFVTSVIFDKTGTLTMGKPTVVKTWSQYNGAVAWAAALAKHSTHPLSQPVAQIASEGTEISDFNEVHGAGIEGTISSVSPVVQVRLGSLRWLETQGVAMDTGRPFIEKWSNQGASVIGLASGTSLAALFALRDTLKPGAREVLAQLTRQGLKNWLITGDNSRTANSIAEQVGIEKEKVLAEILPEEKALWVKKLQEQGERVAFVGDGINDAPALEQADLGIAVSRASDIAREAADIILLKSEIEAVPQALGLARATLRTIKQNLFWAFFYNSAGIPLAALGFMSPILCAAAMGLSDLVVIANALRLRRR